MNLDDIRTTAQDFNMRNDWDTCHALALAKEVLEDCGGKRKLEPLIAKIIQELTVELKLADNYARLEDLTR